MGDHWAKQVGELNRRIRELESELARLEKERANDIEESIAEGVDVGRAERDQLKRERDEARRRVELLNELVRFCRAERDRARKIACKFYAENAACNDLETNRQDCCAACGWNYDVLFLEEDES